MLGAAPARSVLEPGNVCLLVRLYIGEAPIVAAVATGVGPWSACICRRGCTRIHGETRATCEGSSSTQTVYCILVSAPLLSYGPPHVRPPAVASDLLLDVSAYRDGYCGYSVFRSVGVVDYLDASSLIVCCRFSHGIRRTCLIECC